jgi:hypothetical protein
MIRLFAGKKSRIFTNLEVRISPEFFRTKSREASRCEVGCCAMSSSGYSYRKSVFFNSKGTSLCQGSVFSPEKRLNLLRIATFLLVSGLALQAQGRVTCPSELYLDEVTGEGGSRESLRLFAIGPKNIWKELRLQVDPTNGDQGLLFPKNNFMVESLVWSDRVLFYGDELSSPTTPKTPPCGAKWGREVTANGKSGWIFSCSKPASFAPSITYNPKAGIISSKYYNYYFNKKNHILFNRIELLGDDGETTDIAWQSDVNIHADIRNFFSFNFGPSDITSILEDYRLGPMGLVGKVTFYLNLLFFKIKLALVTNVNFFDRSVHIPMVMHAPVNLSKYLNKKSGIVYGWKSHSDYTLENIPVAKAMSPYRHPQGEEPCKAFYCNFAVTSEDLFKMQFQVPKNMFKRQFFPVWAKANEENQDIIPALKKLDNSNGIYFEISSLEKGDHRWDFWMALSSTGKENCPSAANWGRKWKPH